jgi:tetratricopeptide (TPR) repeat protein
MTGSRWGRPSRVFISSAQGGLAPYRAAAIEVIRRIGMTAVCMEEFSPESPPPVDVCRREVESSDVLLLLLAHRYGSRPAGSAWSYTELEYQWATSGKSIEVVAFVVEPDFSWPPGDIDRGADEAALAAFVEAVKARHSPKPFGDIYKFREDLIIALHRFEVAPGPFPAEYGTSGRRLDRLAGQYEVPRPPAFHAVPPYVGNAAFTGRAAQLDELDAWAASGDSMMVVEALGGTGKSALTWEWAATRAEEAIDGLAGRLWWSFYDGSASMTRFLQEVLAYISDRPLHDDHTKYKEDGETPINELGVTDLYTQIVILLRKKPYLLVLDGFERLLSAYHQFDPSKLRDEEVVQSKRSLIEAQAFDALRALTTVRPSKVLISTRLMPDALEGRFDRRLPGVTHVRLPGLTDEDTITLLSRLGVYGEHDTINNFFREVENHPLLIGIVAGLVRDYRPRPGSFDDWRADPAAGGAIAVPDLDLTQRRSHILAAALNGLHPMHRMLLGWISALAGAVNWETLKAINPFESPRESTLPATARLDLALKDLEDRGLLWWDRASNSYDLHPIVRAVAYDQLERNDRVRANTRIASYFEAIPADQTRRRVSSVEELRGSITLFRALVGGEEAYEASEIWTSRLRRSLLADLGAATTAAELLEPLAAIELGSQIELGIALTQAQRIDEAIGHYEQALSGLLNVGDEHTVLMAVLNLVDGHILLGNLASASRYLDLAFDYLNAGQHYGTLLLEASLAAQLGTARHALSKIRKASRLYRRVKEENEWFESGVRYWPLYLAFRSAGSPSIRRLDSADARAGTWAERQALTRLRRDFYIQRGQLRQALEVAHECDRMERDSGSETAPAAIAYLLAALGSAKEAAAAVEEAFDRLPRLPHGLRPYYHLSLALRELGRIDEAAAHAQEAYRAAWGEGTPYCRHWDLRDARALLASLGERTPDLPQFDRVGWRVPLEGRIRVFNRA